MVLCRKVTRFTLLLLVTTALNLFAQSGLDPGKDISQFILSSWETDQGLPQNSVRKIIQSSDGYIWLATEEGLARFDGISFTILNKINTPELNENFINDIFEDSRNNIWVATNGGGVVKISGDEVIPIGPENHDLNFAKCITEDNKGNIWIGTDVKGIIKYSNGAFTSLNTFSGLPANTIHDVTSDKLGNIWVATSKGLANVGSGISVFGKDTEIENLEFFTIKSTSNGLYAGSKNNGFFHISNNRIIDHFTVEDGLLSNEIKAFCFDDSQSLWVGTADGLNRVINGKVKSLTESDGLPGKSIYSLCQDNEKSMWVGTAGGGLVRLRDGKFSTYAIREGLNYDIIWTLFERSNGDIWIGTDGGGINILHKDKTVEIIDRKKGLTNDVIFAFEEDNDGNMWVGTYGGGLLKISGNKITALTAKDGLFSDIIRSIDKDSKGNLWIGTTKGLNVISDGKVSSLSFSESNGLKSSYIRDVLEDNSGGIWVGTRGGGISLIRNGKVTASYTESEGLSNNTVRVIQEDKFGNIWAGTSAGLNKITNGKVTPYTVKDGLFDDPVFALVNDRMGNFWISCNKGVYSVKIDDLINYNSTDSNPIVCSPYGKKDGMRSSECNGTGSPAGIIDITGNIWFPTIKGVVTINPGKIKINQYLPPVYIEKFIADNLSLDPNSMIEIEPGTEKFEFHYTALSYVAPEIINFKYKLEGLDKDWIEAGNRRTAYYNNIPPGTYKFKVIASNNDGIWNETGASIDFDFGAFFYQTIWFYALLVVILGSAIFYFYKRRIKMMKAREDELRGHLETAEINKQKAEQSEARSREMMSEMEKAKQIIENEKAYLAERTDYMLKNIERFSQGDLTVHLSNDIDDEIGKLFAGFNTAINNIKEVFDDIITTIDNTNQSGQQIKEEADNVNHGVENQSFQLNDVLASIEQMNKTINDTAQNIETVSISSERAGKEAKEGASVVNAVIQKMQIIATSVDNSNNLVQNLGESSQRIGEIIGVINDIADQTNLLALNAAIEAARAGEHGRGFAIVADEVRKLSEKTTQATNDISKMIKQIQKDTETVVYSISEEKEEVANGITLVEQAGGVLTKINDNSKELNSVIQQVAAASEEQATASAEIVSNIENIYSINKDFDVAVKQILDSVDHLNKITSQLEEKAGYFTTEKMLEMRENSFLN